MIAYRSDRLDFTPTDWQDLWRQDLQERISLLDQPREVIGLTLKKQGYSYNTEDLSTINNLKTELLKLQKQVKFYASTNYLQPLILGDTWVAVGWSTDILPLVERYPNIQAVIPQSGTAIWADLWVKPKSATANNTNLAQKWIDFCWQPQSVNKISLFTDAVSPLILSMKPEELLVNIRNNPLRLVNQEIMNNSEFIQILPEVSQQQYISLWTEIRSQAI